MISAIIFSKDRALQLDGCLRSLHRCGDGDLAMHVLFRSTSMRGLEAYAELGRGDATFWVETDFEKNFRDLLDVCGATVLLVTDDTLFVRRFSLDGIERQLRRPSVIGFSLRLGMNTKHCYPTDKPQAPPNHWVFGGPSMCFEWAKAEGDFGYPLEVSSSVYRTHDIVSMLEGERFRNPNELEAVLARRARGLSVLLPELMCFEQSVAFSNPINMVQTAWKNRCGARAEYSPEALLDLWWQGKRIDVGAYDGFVPNGCHQEVELKLCTSQ